jgi:hypothetical protein
MSPLPPQLLERLRSLESVRVVVAVADHAKRDVTFEPTTSVATERWHVRAGGRDFELLLQGAKFYDTRAKKGGGGAVDLVMHLFGVGFMDAVGLLKRGGLE